MAGSGDCEGGGAVRGVHEDTGEKREGRVTGGNERRPERAPSVNRIVIAIGCPSHPSTKNSVLVDIAEAHMHPVVSAQALLRRGWPGCPQETYIVDSIHSRHCLSQTEIVDLLRSTNASGYTLPATLHIDPVFTESLDIVVADPWEEPSRCFTRAHQVILRGGTTHTTFFKPLFLTSTHTPRSLAGLPVDPVIIDSHNPAIVRRFRTVQHGGRNNPLRLQEVDNPLYQKWRM